VITLAEHERALVVRRGRPARWLGHGTHMVWIVDRVGDTPAIRVDVIDTGAIVAEPLRDDVKALVPATDYLEVMVPEGMVALRSVDGAIDAELGPGRHAAWTTRRKVAFGIVDLRERLIAITGQDVMTRDKVTLRLNATITVKVTNARKNATVAKNADEAVYLAAQLVLRDAVAGKTLDELLANRDALVDASTPDLRGKASALGFELLELAVKDVILPGEMKTLLNRVIEAQKEAEANVILRREEIAATRSLAQTAKVLAENPILMRLKELEALAEIASKVGHVNVVLGDGVTPTLKLPGAA
jgi:regulator of protease activity HflC (stomatin/prohibitin superfamily)